MKKLISAFCIFLMLSSVLISAYAAEEFVFDDYGYIREAGILNDQAQEIEENTGYTLSCVITNSADDMTGIEQAQLFFEEKFGNNEGIILLDCINTKQCYIYFTPEIDEKLTSEDAQNLFEAYDSQTDYDSAVSSFFSTSERLLASIYYAGEDVIQNESSVVETETRSRIVDYASVLSEYELEKLNSLADSTSNQYRCDVAVVFAESTNGEGIQTFADNFYDYYGYGYGNDADGIMLVIAVNDREYATVTSGYGKTAAIGNALDYLEESIADDLTADKWADAAVDFITACGEVLYNAKFEQQNNSQQRQTELNPIRLLPLNIVIGLVIGFIAVGIMKGKHKSVSKKTEASDYLRSGSFKLTYTNDRFIRSQVNRVKKTKPQPEARSNNTPGSASGFHQDHHMGGPGRPHGGRNGRF
jgi:uncharacterized protein